MLSRPITALVLVGALLSFAPGEVRAQQSKLEPPDLSRYLRWGPLRVRPRIEVGSVGYDDNIFVNDANRVSDFTATVSPGVNGLLLVGHRAFLEFDERISYSAYVDNSDQNYFNQFGTGRLTVPIRRFGVYVDAELNRILERPLDEEDIRTRRKERAAGTGLIFEPSWRTSIELGLESRRLAYSDPDFAGIGQSVPERLDRDESAARLDIAYRLGGRTDLLLRGRRREIDFTSPFVIGGRTLTRDSEGWELLPGIRLGRGGPLTGTAQAGLSRITPNDPALPSYTGFAATLQLVYRFSTRTQLRVDGKRLPGFSLYVDSIYYLEESLRLTGIHYLNRIFGLESSLGRTRIAFPESLAGTDRLDELTEYQVGLRIRLSENSLGRRVEYALRATQSDRTSTLSGLDRSRTRVGLTAIVGF